MTSSPVGHINKHFVLATKTWADHRCIIAIENEYKIAKAQIF